MLPKSITRVLTFFDIFGYNTGSSELSSCRKYLYSINLVHILLGIFFTLFKIHVVVRLQIILRVVEIVNQMLQYSTALFTYWLILLDSMIYWREHRHFWQILEEIDNSFFPQRRISFRTYTLKCVMYIFVATSSFGATAITLLFSEPIFFVISFLVQIGQVRILYYTYCLEVIQLQLKVIEIELEQIKNNNLVSDHNIELLKFKLLREYYHCIHKMTILLNEVFGYSHVAAVALTFYIALTELNWLCSHFEELIRESAYSKFDL